MQIQDIYPAPINDSLVKVEYEYIYSLIGKRILPTDIKSILSNLGIQIIEESEQSLTLSVPPYRVDVQRPCDIVEEILRIYGYNNVEFDSSIRSNLAIQGEVDRSYKLQNLIAEQLVGSGFNEILNNSLTRAAYYDALQSYASDRLVRLMNPLSSDLNVLRSTLLFGGLETISHNVRRQSVNLRLFEYGKCYHYDSSASSKETPLKAYTEYNHLGLWLTGNRVEASWLHENEKSSIYELKRYLLNIFSRLGLQMGSIVVAKSENDIFSAALEYRTREGKVLALLGTIKSSITTMFDISQQVFFADINWDLLLRLTAKNRVSYSELSKFPSVRRDLALLLDKSIEFAEIEAISYQVGGKLLKDVTLFDVYEGKNIEAGKKSYAISYILQDDTQTLNDVAIERVMERILSQLQSRLEAKLR